MMWQALQNFLLFCDGRKLCHILLQLHAQLVIQKLFESTHSNTQIYLFNYGWNEGVRLKHILLLKRSCHHLWGLSRTPPPSDASKELMSWNPPQEAMTKAIIMRTKRKAKHISIFKLDRFRGHSQNPSPASGTAAVVQETSPVTPVSEYAAGRTECVSIQWPWYCVVAR